MTEHPSAALARSLIAALAQRGVEDYVLCPGSRSGPLAHALADAGSDGPPLGAPRVRLHVRIDERTAAFLALGIARGRAAAGDPRPVAIVTTSGTAVGNLMPAVMEAHHAGVPLLLLTADRPAELRGVGANQTTDQADLFGTFVRWSHDVPSPELAAAGDRTAALADRAVHVAMGDATRDDMSAAAGPVHLNIGFREPLGADGGVWSDPPAPQPLGPPPARPAPEPEPIAPVTRGVVVAGDGAGDRARLLAEAHGWPLLAEPTSGARAGSHCIPDYVRLLESAAGAHLAAQAHLVVVVGRPTLTRAVQALIAAAPSLAVAGFGARWREVPRHADRVLRAVPDSWLVSAEVDYDSAWLSAWRSAGTRVTVPDGWEPRSIAAAFLAGLGDAIGVIGSSGPIRAVDRVMPAARADALPTLVANRGLSGIDGTVSTAAGVAFGSGRPVAALVGDLTFLHDAGGLLVGPREARPRLRVVVVNDGGGTIFSGLEHAAADRANVERVFTTPHGADLGALCGGYRVPHRSVRSRDALAAALREPIDGLDVVEAVL